MILTSLIASLIFVNPVSDAVIAESMNLMKAVENTRALEILMLSAFYKSQTIENEAPPAVGSASHTIYCRTYHLNTQIYRSILLHPYVPYF